MAFHTSIFFFLTFFVFLSYNAASQTYKNIALNTTLSPLTNLTSWLSPSGDIAFGFRPLDTDPTLFLLAVYYNKIKDKTVIWTANSGNPISKQSKAELTSDGQLSLKDSSNQEIWSAGVHGASFASVQDNGNFALSSGSSVIWQTFDNPTDTILPGQILNEGSVIYAKLIHDDYTRGRFKLALQNDGNLVAHLVGYPTQNEYRDAYYATNTFVDGTVLVFNKTTGNLYLLFPNNTVTFPFLTGTVVGPATPDGNYLRATLDPDGNFRKYSFPKSQPSTGSWSIEGSLPGDICEHVFWIGSGICGFNSYCTLDASSKVNCQCPKHYSFIDTSRKYKGCKPDFIAQVCEPGSEASFEFETVVNIDWPLSDAEEYSPMNETECKENCLNDCFCSVAIYRTATSTCWKKKFPLSNGN